MTDADIRALAQECGFTEHTNRQVWQSWDGEVLAFARRLIAIGRAEAFEEVSNSVREAIVADGVPFGLVNGEWLCARAAEERERAKS